MKMAVFEEFISGIDDSDHRQRIGKWTMRS
ncbi:hypothetical protein EDC33_1423 [Salinicoccus roseus]|nr:hypothetical protein EDC33_1423 [Salinicoccus roseus]